MFIYVNDRNALNFFLVKSLKKQYKPTAGNWLAYSSLALRLGDYNTICLLALLKSRFSLVHSPQ